jgi:bifunctional polynucleotide phosphatase/kinase
MAYTVLPSTQPRFEGLPLRLALFDLDNTLITSKSGKRWAADDADWVFQGDVPAVLQRYATEGWTVALVTNQFEWMKEEGARKKVSTVLDALFAANAWAPWCLVATGSPKESVYRKPARGLYDVLLRELGPPSEVQMCGDAEGADSAVPEYRWSNADHGFAAAIGARYVTPEVIFGRRRAEPVAAKELVLCVGNMGSGKSTTASALLETGHYIHVENDALKTHSKIYRAARDALRTHSVVIDGCYGTVDARAPFLALARENGIPCRILWHIRDGRPYNALRDKPVPEVAYAVYSKRFEDPRLDGVPVETIY